MSMASSKSLSSPSNQTSGPDPRGFGFDPLAEVEPADDAFLGGHSARFGDLFAQVFDAGQAVAQAGIGFVPALFVFHRVVAFVEAADVGEECVVRIWPAATLMAWSCRS